MGGAGEALDHELSRVMFWTAWRERGSKPRVRVTSQGEVVVERRWPDDLPYVPLSGDERRGRVPRGEGRHILVLGGTGSGKTVSADRIALGRVLLDRIPALVLDPKGDPRLLHDLASLANAVGRPFIVFDPMDPAQRPLGPAVERRARAHRGADRQPAADQRALLRRHPPHPPRSGRRGAPAARALAGLDAAAARGRPGGAVRLDPKARAREAAGRPICFAAWSSRRLSSRRRRGGGTSRAAPGGCGSWSAPRGARC